jgi:hypothetical protein
VENSTYIERGDGNLKERDNLGDLGLDGKIILKSLSTSFIYID